MDHVVSCDNDDAIMVDAISYIGHLPLPATYRVVTVHF